MIWTKSEACLQKWKHVCRHLPAGRAGSAGNSLCRQRISTWWAPKLWTCWTSCYDTITNRDWPPQRPWSTPTSVGFLGLMTKSKGNLLFSEIFWFLNMVPFPLAPADPVVKEQSLSNSDSNMVSSGNTTARWNTGNGLKNIIRAHPWGVESTHRSPNNNQMKFSRVLRF